MGETSIQGTERCKSKRVLKAIVYGNTASPLAKKREEDGHTHQWTVFVKPYHNEDPSKYIRKVQFKLHDSYPNSVRMVEKAPFEVSETGWGEFEVQIKIYFIDPAEKPIIAFHYLRLFQPQVTLANGKTIVAAEYYDEIVFQEPTLAMYRALMGSDARKCDSKRFHTDFLQVRKRTKELVEDARRKINGEVEDLKESLKEAQKLIEKYRKEVDMLEKTAINDGTSDDVSFSIGENMRNV